MRNHTLAYVIAQNDALTKTRGRESNSADTDTLGSQMAAKVRRDLVRRHAA